MFGAFPFEESAFGDAPQLAAVVGSNPAALIAPPGGPGFAAFAFGQPQFADADMPVSVVTPPAATSTGGGGGRYWPKFWQAADRIITVGERGIATFTGFRLVIEQRPVTATGTVRIPLPPLPTLSFRPPTVGIRCGSRIRLCPSPGLYQLTARHRSPPAYGGVTVAIQPFPTAVRPRPPVTEEEDALAFLLLNQP